MSQSQTAGILWLVAALLSAGATVVFRDSSAWYAITLVASAAVALVGILLIWRPNSTTLLLSTIVGVAWVVIYVALIVIQSDDFQAWTAKAFFLLVGGAAVALASRASRQAKPDSPR